MNTKSLSLSICCCSCFPPVHLFYTAHPPTYTTFTYAPLYIAWEFVTCTVEEAEEEEVIDYLSAADISSLPNS